MTQLAASETSPHPYQRLPNADEAKQLLKTLKAFRTEWATFAARSSGLFTAFCEKGAQLPDEFLKRYSDLLRRKADCISEIRTATAAVPAEEWHLPESAASLDEFEKSLHSLTEICAARARQMAEQTQRAEALLKIVASLRCADAEMNTLLTKLRMTAREWTASISHATDDAPSPALLAGQQAGPGDSSETPPVVVVERCRDFLKLAIDGLGAALPDEIHDSVARLSVQECETTFESVSRSFGRQTALAAVRGQWQLSPADLRRAAEAIMPHDQTEQSDRPTSDQLQKLKDNLQRNAADSPAPAPVHETNTPVDHPPLSPVSLTDLTDAVDRLRAQADELSPRDKPALQRLNTADHVRASGFRNLADILELASTIATARCGDREQFRPELHDALKLLAEAQNAVRVERESREGGALQEQDTAFRWLRHITAPDVEAFPIARYMRRDDIAEPGNHSDLARRILGRQREWHQARRAEELLPLLEDALRRITESDSAPKNGAIWAEVDCRVREFLNCGRHFSDVELRGRLLPFSDQFPDEEISDLSGEFIQVVTHIREFIEEQSLRELEIQSPRSKPSPELAKARKLLSGRTIAIVGGTPREEARVRLEEALQVRELIWVGASKSDRVSNLRPQITAASVVVLITALIGHKHNNLRDMCRDMEIPWVQTKRNAGYGANQIAAVILEQASEQLQHCEQSADPARASD